MKMLIFVEEGLAIGNSVLNFRFIWTFELIAW